VTRRLPRYPVYIISKGRADTILLHTAGYLAFDYVPFRVVIEPQDFDDYAQMIPEDRILVLPFSNLGKGGTPARNWVWEHSIKEGHERHWILDDNIRRIYRLYGGHRFPCDAAVAMRTVEDFTDRYENIAISGMNYKMFGTPNLYPYFINTHVYSNLLIRNDLPFRWRLRLNEDTDLCLVALSRGLCTVLVNVFLADKLPTMTMKGGNTQELYGGKWDRSEAAATDGRLDMARILEHWHPGVVRVDRRFQRPQHVIDWKRFKQPLIRRGDESDWQLLPELDEYGLTLRQVGQVKSERMRAMVAEYEAGRAVAAAT